MTYPKMKRGIKATWLRALRSGKYTQGYGRLHTPESDSFCCLGVLCDVLGVEGDGSRALPSYTTQALAGIREDVELHLVNLNDSQRLSFEEIADWIEESL